MNWKLIRILDRFIGVPLIWLSSIMRFRHHHTNTASNIPPQRILLIKFWGIGNIFMMLPSVQGIRTAWPNTHVDILTLTSNQDAVEITDRYNNVFSISTRNVFIFIKSVILIIWKLQHNRYDLVIDFEQFARFSPLLTNLLNAPRTIGFSTAGQHRHHLYTDTVEYNNDIHITRSFYQLVEKAGITAPYPLPVTNRLTDVDSSILDNSSIPLHRPLAVIHIGTSDNFMERRWSPTHFGELCDILTLKHGMTVVLTGLAEEKHLIQATLEQIQKTDYVIDCAGKLTFREYFALIAAAKLVISADTAAVHIASALNIPVAGLYGPNTPLLYGPWGIHGIAVTADFDCSPCITNFNAKINICRHPLGRGACMNAISVSQVYRTLLDNNLLPQSPSEDHT